MLRHVRAEVLERDAICFSGRGAIGVAALGAGIGVASAIPRIGVALDLLARQL
jgi:hypothetical protein